jgi:hypothetical protein
VAGLLAEFGDGWDLAEGLWHRCVKCGQISIHYAVQSYAGRPCGHHDGDGYLGTINLNTIRGFWAEATNVVKWHGRTA